jgi:ribosomal protein S27E
MNDKNILELKPRKFETVYECVNCEGQQFYITESMKLECSSCGHIVNNVFLTYDPPDKTNG